MNGIKAALDEPLGPAQPDSPSGDPAGAIAVLEREEAQLDDGDRERYAHYVRKDKALQSAVEGSPVVALCGKVWTPMRNPDRFPICPICKEIYDAMGSGSGTWPFGPNKPE